MYLDRERLVGEVAKRMNILISKDDPIFACVLLNEIVLTAVLTRAIDRVERSVDHSVTSIEKSSQKIEQSILRASKICGYLDKTIKTIWWQVGAIATLIILVCFVLFVFVDPSIVLTKQDQIDIKNGRMIESAWNKLDKQTQERISEAANKK